MPDSRSNVADSVINDADPLSRIEGKLDQVLGVLRQSIDVADVSLPPERGPVRQPFDITANSALPLYVQLSASDGADGRRYLQVYIFDAYGSVIHYQPFRTKTLEELRP